MRYLTVKPNPKSCGVLFPAALNAEPSSRLNIVVLLNARCTDATPLVWLRDPQIA